MLLDSEILDLCSKAEPIFHYRDCPTYSLHVNNEIYHVLISEANIAYLIRYRDSGILSIKYLSILKYANLIHSIGFAKYCFFRQLYQETFKVMLDPCLLNEADKSWRVFGYLIDFCDNESLANLGVLTENCITPISSSISKEILTAVIYI